PIRIGSYTLAIPLHASAAPGADPRPQPSPEAEAMAWLDRAVSSDRVRYGPFLGTDRLRFTRDVAGVLANRAPTELANYDTLALLVWDRNGNTRLTRRELVRGDAGLRAWVTAHAASTLTASPSPQALRPPATPNALLQAWQAAPPRAGGAPAAHADDPHQDKLAAVIDWALDYGQEQNRRRAATLDTALGPVSVDVDVLPGPESTLRLYGPDGRSWWDGGREEVALDGILDLVSGDAPFPGAEWNSVTARWEGYPDEPSCWTYKLLVDAAHSALPAWRRVADPIRLEPGVARDGKPRVGPEPMRDLEASTSFSGF
ncbi:MAG: hypothetical protein ABIO70_19810, partial [Pseudomonadota bacterium]